MVTARCSLCFRRGFTLVEIIIVLAIVTALAALLLPVFARVREQTRQTTCASNLKHIGVAMRLYAEDNDHFFPPSKNYVSLRPPALYPAEKLIWCDILLPYTKTTQIYNCPSASRQIQNPASARGIVNDYGYNFHISGSFLMKDAIVFPAFTLDARAKTDGHLFRPASTVLVTDAGTIATSGLPASQWPAKEPAPFLIGDAYVHGGDIVEPNQGRLPAPTERHNGKTNVLWADGHVTTQPMATFYNAPDHLRPGDKFPGISPCLRPNMGCP